MRDVHVLFQNKYIVDINLYTISYFISQILDATRNWEITVRYLQVAGKHSVLSDK